MKMSCEVLYLPETTPPLRFAEQILHRYITVTHKSSPDVRAVLLPVPCRIPEDRLREMLRNVPKDATVIGGNLSCLAESSFRVRDLLRDPEYLIRNAAITARCAVALVLRSLPVIPDGCPMLIIGYGRIGSFLARYLQDNGAAVTVCSGSLPSRATCSSLHLRAVCREELPSVLSQFRVILNTAPAPVLTDCSRVPTDCLMYELASVPGILDPRVIPAGGLPGKMAPESNGSLIAQSVLNILSEKERSV